MADREAKEAFVTLSTNDTYALGCLVLGNSLRQVGTTRQLVVMVTPGVTQPMRDQLARVFDLIYDVNLLDSRDARNLELLGRPDLNVTFTKFHCWRLTMYDKAVFLDADTLVIKNVDDLFDREELSAAPDAGWPDCFNSGVFVFRPSEDTYEALIQFALSQGSFDGGDQGLLNMYFRDWATKDINKRLPFLYNVVSQAFYSYLPAFTQFKDDVKIVHFIGATKPWHHPYNTATGTVSTLPGTGHNQEFLQLWWNIFMEKVQPFLDPTLLQFGDMKLVTHHQPPVEKEPPSDYTPPAYHHGTHTTYPAIIPYIPPEINARQNKESSDNFNSSHEKPTSPRSEVVEMPIITRSYNKLESHFSEEPMTSIDSDAPASSNYNVSDVMKQWGEVSYQSKSEKSLENNSKTEYVKSDTNIKKVVKNDSPDTNRITTYNNSVKHEQSNVDENPVSESEQSSLVKGLSSDSGAESMPGAPPLSDRERRFNWERGQADYLGVDAFDNIQKKLLESLQGPPEESPASNSSPFTPKQTEEQQKAEENVKVTSSAKISSSATKTTSAAPGPAAQSSSTATPPPSKSTAVSIAPPSKVAVPPEKVSTAPAPAPVKVATATAPAPVKVATAPTPAPAKVATSPTSESKAAPATASKVAAPAAAQKAAPATAPKVTAAPAAAPKAAPATAPKVTAAPAAAPKVAAAPAKTVAAPAAAPKVAPATAPKVATAPVTAPKATTAPATAPKAAPATAPKVPAAAPGAPQPTAQKAAPGSVASRFGATAKPAAEGAAGTTKPPTTAAKPQSPSEEKPTSRFLPSFLRKK